MSSGTRPTLPHDKFSNNSYSDFHPSRSVLLDRPDTGSVRNCCPRGFSASLRGHPIGWLRSLEVLSRSLFPHRQFVINLHFFLRGQLSRNDRSWRPVPIPEPGPVPFPAPFPVPVPHSRFRLFPGPVPFPFTSPFPFPFPYPVPFPFPFRFLFGKSTPLIHTPTGPLTQSYTGIQVRCPSEGLPTPR